MGRVSQAQARENRDHIVRAAARLFRERGIAGVSVADVTAAAGLTHGGFYKHFASKEALVAEAVGRAVDDQIARLDGYPDRAALLTAYLSPAHRDSPGDGCPTAGFGGDLAREDPAHPARRAYADGLRAYADRLDGDLAAVSTLVGALLLARATAGTPLSDELLEAAAARLAS
jgi:TetR/AcrR family transcriptional regulator, transcriptional repressor for nem operon